MSNEIRNSANREYIELGGSSLLITTGRIYVEIISSELRTTSTRGYIELSGASLINTSTLVYVEISEPVDKLTFYYNGVLLEQISTFKYNCSIKTIDTTALNLVGAIPGLSYQSIEVSGFWYKNLSTALDNLNQATSVPLIFIIKDRGNQIVEFSFSSSFVESFSIENTVDNVVMYNIKFIVYGNT